MTEERLPSKFTFILHADIAGSTALVQQDEEVAHKRIQDTFRRFSDIIFKYHGHVQELRGDAILAEFERASDAVTAALAFQADQSNHLAQLDDSIQPKVRVGIAMGEVIIADDTITGEGVVLAQRVEQLADPGGVCVTGAIQEALPTRLPFAQSDLGEQKVKGFDKPVHVYSVRLKEGATLPGPTIRSEIKRTSAVQWIMVAAVAVLVCGGALLAWLQPWKPDFEPASVEQMSFPLPDNPSIAVLPFENYSDDLKMEFFASGLTEDLTAAFSRSPWLFVIARNSAATYKGKPVNVKQVAEDLGIQYVLEGSVQKAGDNLRITTQLVDALSGKHLWAGRFDRPASDVFAVQDEITKRVLTELQVELTMGDSARIRSHGTGNLDAWLLQLEGYSEMNKWTKDSLIRARELYASAYEADPNWAWPLAGTAITHWFDAKQGWSESREESIQLGFESAERAIEIDPNGALGFGALANLYFLTNQPERGTELSRKGIELAPNDFNMVANMAMRIKDYGREQEAIELFEHTMRLSPKHPWWVSFGYGLALHLVGRQEDAVQAYKQAISLGAQNSRAYARLAAVYADMGQMDDAKAAIKEGLRLEPNYTASHYGKAYPMHDPRRDEWYKNLLVQAGLPEHPPLELPDKPSIAVLPFTNMSNDPEQEYFVDGMTEDLITDLSKISGLFVIARNSSFTYKGKAVDVKNVARDLGVRYVLEGSVRRANNQVRINAQLIDATTGGHLWADRYDRELSDIFNLQDQVTQQIVDALAINLPATERGKRASAETGDLEVYDTFLRGWVLYRQYTSDSFAAAIPHFEKALAHDPTYGRAYAALADIYFQGWRRGWADNFGMPGLYQSWDRADEYMEKALKYPTALAHSVAANMLAKKAAEFIGEEGALDKALVEAKRAIELDPNDPVGYLTLGGVLTSLGGHAEAIEQIKTAMRLDPQQPTLYLSGLGYAQFMDEQYDAAAESLEALTKHPSVAPWNWLILGATYGQQDRMQAAQFALEKANALRSELGWHDYNISDHIIKYWTFGNQSDRDQVVTALRKIGVPDRE